MINLEFLVDKYLEHVKVDCKKKLEGYITLIGKKIEPYFTGIPLINQSFETTKPDDAEALIINDICEINLDTNWVLLGDPGSGKSVSLLNLSQLYATQRLAKDDGVIPVYIPLSEFNKNESFPEFVKKFVPDIAICFDELKDKGNLVFFFDAFNEVPSNLKDDVLDGIINISKKNRYVITCRSSDYENELSEIPGIGKIQILKLSPFKIKQMLNLYSGNDGLWNKLGGSEQINSLWEKYEKFRIAANFWDNTKTTELSSLKEREAWDKMHEIGILPLCINPFMLKLICNIYSEPDKGNLPKNRSELFMQFTEKCIGDEVRKMAKKEKWNNNTLLSIKNKSIDSLRDLAKKLQLKMGGTSISIDDLNDKNEIYDVNFIICINSGLIIKDGERFRFLHHLIQEFFAGEVLKDAFEKNEKYKQFTDSDMWWKSSIWDETAIIFSGRKDICNKFEEIILWIAEANPRLAVRCIDECGLYGISLSTIPLSLKDKLFLSFNNRLSSDEDYISRWHIGDSLSKIEDTREGVGTIFSNYTLLPDILWSEPISNSFCISVFQITVQQFKSFVEDNGLLNKEWRKGIKNAKDELFNNEQLLGEYLNHPITNVNWYEAYAFCQWLSTNTGEIIRLPLCKEWEEAIGITKYDNPCSDEDYHGLANVLGSTREYPCSSPVGIFSNKGIQSKAFDMCGNVWEWCYDNFDDECEIPFRILKGGSFNYKVEFSKKDYIMRTFPRKRAKDIGFRIIKEI